MAFAARNYRIFCKVYCGNLTAAYSTLHRSVRRINLLPSIQKYEFINQNNRPKIENLTNVRQSTSGIPFTQIPKEKQDGHQGSSQENPEDEEEIRRREKSWKYTKYSLIGMGVSFGIAGGWFIYETSLPFYDPEGNAIEDEFSDMSFIPRTYNRVVEKIRFWTKVIKDPSSDKLLPDPDPNHYHPPTLVLEVTDVLVHPEWTYKTGWRFKKRPGVDLFLETLAQYFELVIYTGELPAVIAPVLESLDPKGMAYKFMRETTRFINGQHVKDLDVLNRDLKKVIVVDWNPSNVMFHSDNLFKIPRWKGNDDDTTLYYLASFLKTVASMDVNDVRDVLLYYQQFEDPVAAFIMNQQKLAKKLEEDEMMKMKSENNKNLISRWSTSFLRSH